MFNPFKKKQAGGERPPADLPRPPRGMDFAWTCACCGKRFGTLPTDYFFEGPVNYLAMSQEERSHVAKTDDICVVSNTEMYVRGVLPIRILGTDEELRWGVWCSVSDQTMRYIYEHENKEYPEGDQPRFGWLCNWPDGYKPTEDIKCHLYFRNQNLRPLVALEPTDYALAVEQRGGVSIQHVQQIAAKLFPH